MVLVLFKMKTSSMSCHDSRREFHDHIYIFISIHVDMEVLHLITFSAHRVDKVHEARS